VSVAPLRVDELLEQQRSDQTRIGDVAEVTAGAGIFAESLVVADENRAAVESLSERAGG
jgi:hypothetical protein